MNHLVIQDLGNIDRNINTETYFSKITEYKTKNEKYNLSEGENGN